MGLGPRLDLRTSQTLVVSPQLQAAIKLLTLSNLELQAEIAAELDRNPFLEVAEEGGQGGSEPAEAPEPATESAEAPPEGMEADLKPSTGEDLDVDLVEERFHHDSVSDSARGGEGEDFSFDNLAAGDRTLGEVLEAQVLGLDPADQPIAFAIVGAIDEAGYLTETIGQIGQRMGIPAEEVERVLLLVQGFEPTGIGARTLSECIALQAKEADRYDPCMAALIDNLELVARGDLAQLRRLCDVDAEDLADMLRELRSYDPKPGLAYGSDGSVAVVPDVFVRRTARGWTVELNGGTLPRLIVNREYRASIPEKPRDSRHRQRADKQFIDQCVSQAQWMVKVLDQRANTILKVVSAILEQQRAFFDHGVRHLKPLTLRSIADVIGMHESTVSRVTSNKYLSCDRGMFELKYFFTSAIQAGGGEETSAEAVRAQLKALIDAEPPLKPLSDDKLVELLKKDGFELARRTVTKYREAMGIPSSVDRRRRALVKAA